MSSNTPLTPLPIPDSNVPESKDRYVEKNWVALPHGVSVEDMVSPKAEWAPRGPSAEEPDEEEAVATDDELENLWTLLGALPADASDMQKVKKFQQTRRRTRSSKADQLAFDTPTYPDGDGSSSGLGQKASSANNSPISQARTLPIIKSPTTLISSATSSENRTETVCRRGEKKMTFRGLRSLDMAEILAIQHAQFVARTQNPTRQLLRIGSFRIGVPASRDSGQKGRPASLWDDSDFWEAVRDPNTYTLVVTETKLRAVQHWFINVDHWKQTGRTFTATRRTHFTKAPLSPLRLDEVDRVYVDAGEKYVIASSEEPKKGYMRVGIPHFPLIGFMVYRILPLHCFCGRSPAQPKERVETRILLSRLDPLPYVMLWYPPRSSRPQAAQPLVRAASNPDLGIRNSGKSITTEELMEKQRDGRHAWWEQCVSFPDKLCLCSMTSEMAPFVSSLTHTYATSLPPVKGSQPTQNQAKNSKKSNKFNAPLTYTRPKDEIPSSLQILRCGIAAWQKPDEVMPSIIDHILAQHFITQHRVAFVQDVDSASIETFQSMGFRTAALPRQLNGGGSRHLTSQQAEPVSAAKPSASKRHEPDPVAQAYMMADACMV